MNPITLTTGKTYSCSKPSVSFQDPNGNEVIFSETTYRITVLDKPKKVMADCGGHDKQEIDLPAHLSKSEWAFVLNLSTNEKHWLNTLELQINKL